MKLSQIIDAWKEDSKIDDLNIDNESVKIISLHAKYIEWLSNSRGTLRGFHIQRNHLTKKLRDYYLGVSTQEQLEELKRDPHGERILKNELMMFVESDELMIDLNTKLTIQEEKVETLTEIMKSINSRNYILKNYIDWKRLMLGG